MIHLGIEKLEYKVRFDPSCYYPFTFSEERRNTKILFGTCFGLWWWTHSISIARRPSENQIDKMDLFSHTYWSGFKEEEYTGSIDIEKNYTLKLIFQKHNNVYRIQAFSEKESKPVINSCTHYKYPLIPFGYSIHRTYGDKILLEKK